MLVVDVVPSAFRVSDDALTVLNRAVEDIHVLPVDGESGPAVHLPAPLVDSVTTVWEIVQARGEVAQYLDLEWLVLLAQHSEGDVGLRPPCSRGR